MGSIRVQEKGKEMGNRNITPIATLRHHQNILFTVDVVPGVRVVDVVVVHTGSRGTNTAEVDGRGMDMCSGGTNVTRFMEGSSSRRGESICQWRGYWTD